MATIFEGQRVRLRAPDPSDTEIFKNWDRVDTESARSSYEIPFPEPRFVKEITPTLESRPRYGDDFLFIFETLDGTMVGSLNTHHCNPRNGTFMYGVSILPEHRRKGYAFEGIQLVLRYFFDERRYQKCNVEVYSFNPTSARLHERLGFTLEGRLRRMIYTNGAFHDVLVYGITHEEFLAHLPTLKG